MSRTREEAVQQVRETVIHELGHGRRCAGARYTRLPLDSRMPQLGQVTAGDDRNADRSEQSGQQRLHLSIERGFALRKRAVQVENDECLQRPRVVVSL